MSVQTLRALNGHMGHQIQRQVLRSALEKKIYDHMIALRAWQIWKAEGCPLGKEVEHWLQAEEELQLRQPSPRMASPMYVAASKKIA